MIILLMLFSNSYAQQWLMDSTVNLHLIARPMPDSIILRWAPMNHQTWNIGNRFGYKVIRYTIIRDEVMLAKAEEKVLTALSLKPLPMDNWKPLVEKNKYAAIAAQALFGKSFEVQTGGLNPEILKNKVTEQQQRFGFALYAADLSPEVAEASGLMLVDKDAKKNEKYLYRVMIDIPQGEKFKRDTGYIFTGISEYTPLPKPFDLKSEFNDRVVVLRWNSFVYNNIFIAYNIERSSDGRSFERVNKNPVIQITTQAAQNPELIYAADSLSENGKTYFYRVQGITSFGELSPYSELTSGKGTEQIAESPDIIKQEIIKGKVKLIWDFPIDKESKITGFRILRSDNDKAGFKNIAAKPIKPSLREFIDKSPLQTAYYKIEAYKDTLYSKKSFPTLVQLTDSIPPVKPKGLKGSADTAGIVRLSWLRNADQDIYGYRVFRSVSGKDEYSQLTSEPIADTFFADTLSKKDLNAEVYYKILANDQRQNQSEFSEILKIIKPDLIAPSAPVIKEVKTSERGIEIRWINSNSADVERYHIYRQNEGDTVWTIIAEAEHKKKETETIYYDTKAGNDTIRLYKVIALDLNGNQSAPAISIPAKAFKSMLKPGIGKIEKIVDNEKGRVILKWKKPEGEIKNYVVYRKTKEKNYSMYETLPGTTLQFEDYGLRAGDENAYRIRILFMDGSVSGFSEEIFVKY